MDEFNGNNANVKKNVDVECKISDEVPIDTEISRNDKEIDPDIKKILEKYLSENGIANYTMKISPGSSKGDNFLGDIAKVKINGIDKNGFDVEFNWVIKIAPQSEMYRKSFRVEIVYEREIFMYETVFPMYRKLEDEKSILNSFNSYPEFVLSYLEPCKESLVMKDMKLAGYVMVDKNKPLNIDHVNLVMKAYGKLHALSYALKFYKPNDFAILINRTKDIFESFDDSAEISKYFDAGAALVLSTLDSVKDASVIKKFLKYKENTFNIATDCCKSHNEYSVIGHGDAWMCNMLFKYDNPAYPGIPTDVCLLDFQLSRYASPACDLSYFIFACTDKALRDEYYDKIIKLYYYTLRTHLNDLGCDPEKLLPFEALQAELKRFSIIGIHMASLALMALTKETEEIPDINNSNEEEMLEMFSSKGKNQAMYNERVRNIVVEFAERGYLDFLQ